MSDHEELSAPLARAVDAARDVPADAATRASQRLHACLAAAPRRTPRLRLAAAFATAAIALVVVVAGLLPVTNDGIAFAAVQAHFRTFRTLRMDVTTSVEDRVVQATHTFVDAYGATRTDIGTQLSVVVDPERGRVLMLMHEAREASVTSIPRGVRHTASGEPDWLEELRTFKGRATPLAEARTIDGVTAQGWTFEARGTHVTLWADASGLPLAMELPGPGGMRIDMRFTFDVEPRAGLFDTEPPADYTLAPVDED